MKLICCIALFASGESYFKQRTAHHHLGIIRSSNYLVSQTSLYESSSPVEGSMSPDIQTNYQNEVILLRESSQTSLNGRQDDEDDKGKHSPIHPVDLLLELPI
jgi:hypothetical protein